MGAVELIQADFISSSKQEDGCRGRGPGWGEGLPVIWALQLRIVAQDARGGVTAHGYEIVICRRMALSGVKQ